MTKFLSKRLFILMSVVLIFALLAACGDKKEEAAPPATPTPAAETPKAPAEKAAEPASQKPTEKPTDRTLSLGTTPVGVSYNSVGSGIASVISQNSEVRVSVKPFAGLTAWGPLLDKGEVDLGVASGPEVVWAFHGDNEFPHVPNVRQLVRGNFLSVTGAAVAKNSDINSIADLKGKRVASDYPGSIIGKMILEAALVSNGLTWDDVTKVPIPTTLAGIEALRDNRLDAAFALTPTTPIMLEVHNAIGLKSISFFDDFTPATINDIPQEKIAKINELIPGSQVTVIEPLGYITEKTLGLKYPAMMVASSKLDDATAYSIMETLWANYEELHPIHLWLKTWTPENMFDPKPTVPYHPGAVKFFKDKGLWNDDVEKIQQDLLKLAS